MTFRKVQEDSDEIIRQNDGKPLKTGEARATPGRGLIKAKYIIHAVGPIWKDVCKNS